MHEKLMHFIVVRKDLQEFQRLHPAFDQETGEFRVDVDFTVDEPYRYFGDFTPGEENPQKPPVTLLDGLNVANTIWGEELPTLQELANQLSCFVSGPVRQTRVKS